MKSLFTNIVEKLMTIWRLHMTLKKIRTTYENNINIPDVLTICNGIFSEADRIGMGNFFQK